MIDLIIPYYNNPEGLKRTLQSVNKDIFYITVVDDCSTIPYSLYPEIDQIFRYNENRGPGYARQYGIDHTSNDFIMFIDAGDIFLSKEIQKEIDYIIKANPLTDVFSWLYYYKDNLTQHTDNRMHGKVYHRDFLKKYHITFCDSSSYMNEDIGFNRLCRIIINNKHLVSIHIDKPVIYWVKDEESLT